MKQIQSNGRYAVIGASGSGKSNSVYILLEDLRKRRQPVIVIDHKGEYLDLPDCHVLRAADTNPKDLPVRLRESKISVVLDIRSANDPKGWLATFLKGCLRLPRKAPMLIAIEEAHNYVPEVGQKVESKIPVSRVAAEGRSMGYGLLLISQRCSKLHKDSLTQAQVLYIHRLSFKTDLNYMMDIVGKENLPAIRALKTGQVIHMDLENDIFEAPIQMPLANRKKAGGTPEAVAVTENKQAFIRPNIGRPTLEMMAEREPGPTAWMLAAALLVVCIVIAITLMVYRSMNKTDERIDREEEYKGWMKHQSANTPE